MKDELRSPLKHEHVHEIPTVIHHPEEDLPLLARWLDSAMANQARFWTVVGAVVLLVVGLSVVGAVWSGESTASNSAWTELDTAKSAADRVEIASKYPDSPVERWALMQAAYEYYRTGFADLPNNRDAALPQLEKALTYYKQVAKEAPKDSVQARTAAFGVARTHEARNEIDKAIAQYEVVTKNWPESEEGKEAKRLAELLKKPEAVAFYRELYTFKPTTATLAPMESTSIPIPPIGSGGTVPSLLPPPPPSNASGLTVPLTEKAEEKKADTPTTEQPKPEEKKAEQPKVEEPKTEEKKPDAPKVEQPKPEEKKAEQPKADTAGGLPADVFAPSPAAEPK